MTLFEVVNSSRQGHVIFVGFVGVARLAAVQRPWSMARALILHSAPYRRRRFAADSTIMPIYEYHCPACDKHFELLVRSDTVPTCPQCGATQVHKCVSAPQPPGKSAGIIKRARQRAAAEGHFSHFSQSERNKLLS